jgi:hypothetical protein
VKRVSNFEKEVLSGLLRHYNSENLEKINKELELKKASRHDELLRIIQEYKDNVFNFVKEP